MNVNHEVKLQHYFPIVDFIINPTFWVQSYIVLRSNEIWACVFKSHYLMDEWEAGVTVNVRMLYFCAYMLNLILLSSTN